MSKFAFTPYNDKRPDEPSDLLKSRTEAHRLRKHLVGQGHEAHVESGRDGEHRVWVQHPQREDTAAYVHGDDLDPHGNFKPYWIRK